MESATSKLNGNPKNVNYIGGIPVDFPYQPYGPQLAFMARVISTLDRAQRDGRCHALLESPTGTGKSLSLLCSTLAWQKHHGTRDPNSVPPPAKPDPRASNDPLNYGGGFCPESQPSSAPASASPSVATKGKSPGKKQVTTIFYASRTHSQISQVIREYRKTSYRVPMAVLASRKHYCTNKNVRSRENLDEECKLLMENRESGCPEFKNACKVKSHPSLQKGGCHEVHDIEDLVKVGQIVKGCSYFAARSLATDAHIVFCPYSYIINPIIRRAMEVDIQGSVVILDEAHNIEDIARDAGSSEIDEDSLFKLQRELSDLCLGEPPVYQPLYEMVQDITSWMEQRKSTLEKREFQHYFSSWSGDKALKELEAANLSRQCFPSLQECAIKAIKAASDTELGFTHLSGISAITLEGLFSSLSYFFGNGGTHVSDYQVALRRFIKRNDGHHPGIWTYTFNLWCLNPAVVFKDIANASLSVILTSGTLSPMNSFSSELGVQFSASLEAPHVINIDTQVWVGALSVGQGNYPMNASYKAADSYAFQDALGKTLEEIFNNVPGGSLVFFPSYKLMDKLSIRWHETGQWSRLTSKKPVFVEPKGGSQDDLEPVLRGYYDAIRFGSKPCTGRKKKGKKADSASSNAEVAEACKKKGAVFLAVCRGKVSEGIDFSDDYARAVIIIGIPFPNIFDIQVAEKKKYNDMNRHSKQLLSGSDWYCHQAFRALNQAAGRCIRHRYDHGAIIFLDERYREERTTMFISKWLRKSIRQYCDFETSMHSLKTFLNNVKIADTNLQPGSVATQDNLTRTKCGTQSVRINQKSTKREAGKGKLVLGNIVKNRGLSRVVNVTAKHKTFFQPNSSKGNEQNEASSPQTWNGWGESKGIIDLEYDSQESSRFPYMPCSAEGTQDCCVVKETPCTSGKGNMTAPESFSKDDTSSSTIIRSSIEVEHTLLPNVSTSKTPERNIGTRRMSEIESPLNSSVNSYSLKKRKSLHCPIINLVEETSGIATSPNRISLIGCENVDQRFALCSKSEYKCNSDILQSSVDEGGSDCFITSISPGMDQVTSPRLSVDKDIAKANDLTSRDTKIVDISSIDKYSFQSQSGWRSTKSKLRLPRRALLRNTED